MVVDRAGAVDDVEVEVGEELGPADLSTIEGFGGHEILDGDVVDEYLERRLKGKEEWAPFGAGGDNAEKFLVVNLVVPLCRRERARGEGDRVPEEVVGVVPVLLEENGP